MMVQKILVVDDDAAILEMLHAVLTDEGYDVRTANPSNAAHVVAAPFQPDVILMDVLIPEIASQPRTCALAAPTIPIILMTTARHEKLPAAPAIVVDYLVKPFDLDVLFAKISSILAASRV